MLVISVPAPTDRRLDKSVRPTRASLNPGSFLWHHLCMPKIHIPTPLRQYSGKQPAVEVTGTTFAETLSRLFSQHPDLRRHLYTDKGKLLSFFNAYRHD